MNTEKQISNAKKMVLEGLQELAHQLERTDADAIAKELKITSRVVRMYIAGTGTNTTTGIEIIKAARSIILKREKSIQKLVA